MKTLNAFLDEDRRGFMAIMFRLFVVLEYIKIGHDYV